MELDHVVLEVADPLRSMAFYRSVLGLESVRAEAFVSGKVPFPSVRVNAGTVIDLFPAAMWAGRRKTNPNHFCLTLSSAELAALRRRLRARAIPVVRESRRNFGARGYARSIYLQDPDGVTVEARCYPEGRRRSRTK